MKNKNHLGATHIHGNADRMIASPENDARTRISLSVYYIIIK